jgi:hypothetical protein
MATMMRYTFRALITLSPEVPENPAPCGPGRACALAAGGCYLIQPFSCREYIPAMIWLDEGAPVSPGGPAVLTVALADSEAEAFFCPGQCFTMWADGLVGSTVQAMGRAGYGVIARRMSPARARADGTGIPGSAAGQAVASALLQAGAPR